MSKRVRDLTRRPRCWVMGHEWSAWAHFLPGRCFQRRTCARCRAEQLREAADHAFTDWRPDGPRSCQQMRSCKRCGHVEHGAWLDVKHSYGDWQPMAGSCRLARTCSRCREVELGGEQHRWGDWRPGPGPCDAVQTCLACGIDHRETTHQWREAGADGACQKKRICSRCGAVEIEYSHNWVTATFTANTGGTAGAGCATAYEEVTGQRCTQCGDTQW